ncbi:glycosyltransferase 87 family protein [Geobacter sp. AOG1]|uniref:glycosyltransferase 87 family protein n=1 Tax=Geobacter sp. AOG1 TaxID=1566346 RepID=UPI001CC4AF6E|nr:glycosyltransferase 87 family protein [Geobacter sp. AOG1]GFE58137.1 hypothetical protein AOG1_20170 [Geobacter sp. AOG1]
MSEPVCPNGANKLKTISTIVIIGFTLSVIFHYILANYCGLERYFYRTFLFDPADRFNDFYNIYRATGNLDPYSAPVSVYFPLTFIVMYLFTLFNEHFAFALFLALFGGYFVWYIFRNMPTVPISDRWMSVFVLTFMSYPVLFNFDRGNVEAFVFICITLFIYFHRKGQDLPGVLFLSLAIAMKLYPGVFVVLYLAERKYRNIIVTACTTAVISLASAAMLNGGILHSLEGLRRNLAGFNTTYLITKEGLQHNSSLYGVIRMIAKPLPQVQPFIDHYTVIALAFFVLVAAYIVLKEDILWKKVALLVFSMILLPQVSFDYKLIHLFVPTMLFINTGHSSRFTRVFAVMFGLMLIPKDYIQLGHAISIAVLLNPLLMVGIAVLILLERFERSPR